MTGDRIAVFTDTGSVHTVRVRDIPYGKFRDKGTPVDNLCNYSSSEEMIVHVDSMEQTCAKKLLFATASGMVKIVEGTEFDTSRRTAAATKLGENDRVVTVADIDGYDSVVLQSAEGYFLKFPLTEVSEMKKNAVGTHGIKLADGDRVEAAMLVRKGRECTIPYRDGEVSLSKLRSAKRGGRGTRR